MRPGLHHFDLGASCSDFVDNNTYPRRAEYRCAGCQALQPERMTGSKARAFLSIKPPVFYARSQPT
jgi:hypothetical protein